MSKSRLIALAIRASASTPVLCEPNSILAILVGEVWTKAAKSRCVSPAAFLPSRIWSAISVRALVSFMMLILFAKVGGFFNLSPLPLTVL